MPNIQVTRAEFESYWVNRRRRKRRLDTLQRLLFGHGEDGFLFGNFAELDELFTTSVGPTAVAANDDPVGLALDDHGWGGQTLAQVVAAAIELRGNGVIGLLGSATVATYNPGTGVGSVTRVDADNQSYVTFPVVATDTYAVDITPVQNVYMRGSAAGAILLTAFAGSRQTYYVKTGTTVLSFTSTAPGTANFTVHSIKAVPGNHALQATTGNRPLWKANAGKPYLLFDGSNDTEITPFLPTTALMLAAAARFTGADDIVLGGGSGAGSTRAVVGVNASGFPSFGWGSAAFNHASYPVDIRNTDRVLVLEGDASRVRLWMDGVVIMDEASTGNPGGTTGVALGSWNNADTPSNFFTGNLHAAVGRNQRPTETEIARITADFQRTF